MCQQEAGILPWFSHYVAANLLFSQLLMSFFFCFLSALLFNEVKYVETLADLENIENVLKGKSSMVFAYVPATGTAGMDTQLSIFPFFPSLFLVDYPGAEFLTQNPANENLKGPPSHTISISVCPALFPKFAPGKFCWEHKP